MYYHHKAKFNYSIKKLLKIFKGRKIFLRGPMVTTVVMFRESHFLTVKKILW